MAFTPPVTQQPTGIPKIHILLTDTDDTGFYQPAGKTVLFELFVVDQDGKRMKWDATAGNAVPHLTQEEVDWLLAFADSVRARAELGILGT